MTETAGAEVGANGSRGRDWFSRFEGMGPFTLLWSGHVVTLIGTSILKFAFIIRAWTSGGQATEVVLLSLCAMLPRMLLSPTAGALVDRWNRRTALQMADLCGLLVIGGLSTVYFAGDLQLWHIYLAVALAGCAEAFQYPALLSTVPHLVGKDQLQRANGMLATAKSTADIGGPALGGLLVAVASLGPILVLDVVSFAVALAVVRVVPIPTTASPGPKKARGKLFDDSLEGLRYIFARPSLRGLVVVFFTVNLTAVLGFAVLQPMILARTDDDSASLASVVVCIGIGGVAGGSLLAAWGGPTNKVRGMMLGVMGMSLFAQIITSIVRFVPGWMVAAALGAAMLPMINGSVQAVIQSKVSPDKQGRVFGGLLFCAQIAAPLAMALAGPLADHVFEPQAESGSGLAGLFAPLLGDGPGSGMATMLLLAGLLSAAAAAFGLLSRPIRDIDELMPDIETEEKVTA